ncbi:MAG TPA: hypothetical protein VJB14_16830 [Planctomycetota bacterium]|nr:hypothetical protein [Planctomycetota bacterium]
MLKAAFGLALLFAVGPQEEKKPLRLGIIGLDTSHVVAFTQVLNDEKNANHVPGARVVAAFKGGSPDVESSATMQAADLSKEKGGVPVKLDELK